MCSDQKNLWLSQTFTALIRTRLDQVEQVTTMTQLVQHVDFFVSRITTLYHMLTFLKETHNMLVFTKFTRCIALVL